MRGGQINEIVIIGGGIASSTLAILLARAGRNVIVLDHPARIDLLVGESLLPAVVPILQQLGIELEVQAFSMYKPGAAFIMRNGHPLMLDFSRLRGVTSTYAYNIPRPRFDDVFRHAAIRAGARVVRHRVRPRASGDHVLLDHETLSASGLRDQPDLVIDCSGRAQVLRRLFHLGGRQGRRRDVCVFAHYEDVDLGVPIAGVVVISVMDAGWVWRIPLQGRTSVGVVVDRGRLERYGATPSERLDYALSHDAIMATAISDARRISDVRTYNNYQWLADRFTGGNWVMVGDAAGFVDPALSSGVLLALEGASGLAALIDRGARGLHEGLAAWEREYRARIAVWQGLVDAFYDGHLFSMIMQGHDYERVRWMKPLNQHVARNFTGAVTGARTMSPYSRRLVRILLAKGIRNYTPEDWAVST